MAHWTKRHPYGSLIIGIGLGLLVGIGMMFGALTAISWNQSPSLVLPETMLHATGSDSGTKMAIATGPITEGVEGVFILDFLTGDLSGWVINRRTGRMGGLYKHNVVQDLGVVQGKAQKYLMVTGAAPMTRGGSQAQPADCFVYVVDQNTGNFVAYGLRVNRSAYAAGAPQVAPLIPIAKGCARNVNLGRP